MELSKKTSEQLVGLRTTSKKKMELDWTQTETMMTALPNASGIAGERWRRQHKTEWSGDESSVAYASLGLVTRQKLKSDRQLDHPKTIYHTATWVVNDSSEMSALANQIRSVLQTSKQL